MKKLKPLGSAPFPSINAAGSAEPDVLPKLVPALVNAISVIEAINMTPSGNASLAELTGALGMTKSHCHAILKTLTHAGWLRFDKRFKTYELSAGLLVSCSSLVASPEIRRIRERLARLVEETGFSCVLTQPQPDGRFVVLDNIANRNPMLLSIAIGYALPADSPAQIKAQLAWQPEPEREAWLANWTPEPYTSSTLMRKSDLRDEFEATRQRGYSRSIGEHFEGMLAYGMPIFGRDANVRYIFCLVSFVGEEAEAEAELRVSKAMMAATHDIHNAMMATPPAGFPQNP
jgi:IclR family acetate operon transcriptional repressor